MRISLSLTMFDYPDLRSSIATIAKTAEAGGFYAMAVMDHLFQIGLFGPPEGNMLESYTTLGYLAGITNRLKIGTLVTGTVYRSPGLLAKIVSALDVLSGGRAFLGIGAAWNNREATGLGLSFPDLKERFERLEEALQIVLQMWDEGNNGPYQGKHFQLAETLNHPRPIQQPHPPILIGGMGEKKTLRLVAQYADVCNLLAVGSDVVRQRLEVLKRHCDAVGRSYHTIEKTLTAGAFFDENMKTTDDILAFCEEMAQIGIEHIFFHMPETETLKPLDIFAEKIIPAVAELEPANRL